MKLRISLMSFAAGAGACRRIGVRSGPRLSDRQDSRFNWKSYHDFADKYDLKGQTLSIFGPWLTADKDGFEKVLAYFEEATGAKIENSGSDSFEQQIVIDTQAGSPANISIFPQPGLAADVASKGYLTPLGDDTKQWLLDNYAAGQSWVDLSTYKDKDGNAQLFAFPWKADLKSLVWYVPENFKEAGYEIPKTMEDLKALTEQIVKDGGTPWCIGLGSGAATGWPATDWVEDFMLRLNPPDVYDGWVNNTVKFNDPRVDQGDRRIRLVRQERQVRRRRRRGGGLDRLPRQPEGPLHLAAQVLHAPPGVVHPGLLPRGHQARHGRELLLLPALCQRADLGKPVLGAGTLFAITKDSPAARAFIEFLKTPIASEIAMAAWNFFTPFKVRQPGRLSDRHAARARTRSSSNATTFRFDGSDQMPGKIGAGSFWTGMVDYVGGKSAEDVADRDPEVLGRDQVGRVTLHETRSRAASARDRQNNGRAARSGGRQTAVSGSRTPRRSRRR